MPVSDFIRGLTASALFAVVTMGTAPASAGEKEETCKLQAELMSAVQQARLDRVPESQVVDKVTEDNPHWPETLHSAIPAIAEFMYDQKRRDLKQVDLGPVSEQQCLDNWEQIQEMKKSGS
ncbi:hypothetical protein [uncultured Shimia sp.]|uniref:hypothetical protein n=1 Tax=uncultured Shimia sp. TaxID=573152 RepID=UPI002613EF78|nr:hypothetical protein [uncultured Shimia sp.]